ncbi:lysis system i-spanin subunit Rz [Deefgea sp. CFH1-16]|uniref:lysis system i-spanin subunit Rz n=1 Tax=Deefgea sp. CFH1-16 TaxID=2675457 RepID=UPI0015F38A00|nr:lysis system i-spanin subunit Rz [Deefgea sp. CFH1-16]MBM5575848.1 hypothetical protein [Deefgea sp. CFH1-16]
MFGIERITLLYQILITLFLLVLMFFAGTWQGAASMDKSWQLKDAQRDRDERKAAIKAYEAKLKDAALQASRIAALDQNYQQELNHAQTENDRLRRDIRTGLIRLSVKSAKPAGIAINSATASNTDAAAICELDATTADDLISITSDGDTAIRQLSALQGYISTILEGQP